MEHNGIQMDFNYFHHVKVSCFCNVRMSLLYQKERVLLHRVSDGQTRHCLQKGPFVFLVTTVGVEVPFSLQK